MMKIGNSSLVRAALALALLALTGQAQAVTEVQWWHSMTGALNDRVNDIAKRFNESQKDYKVTPAHCRSGRPRSRQIGRAHV